MSHPMRHPREYLRIEDERL
ncbi:hypothetical protein AZE42_09973, partial [Rhizopogon vesiculosus]